jgi:hypothetical protein
MTARDYAGIARAIREASLHDTGATAQRDAFEDLAEAIAGIFAAADRQFDRRKF